MIPVEYGQITAIFSGIYVPRGAAITWGFDNQLADNTATEAADLAVGLLEAELMPVLVDGVTLEKVIAKLGPDDVGPSVEVASGTAGTDISAGTPPNTAYLVRKNSNLGGRRGRGRMYVPGVDETQVDGAGAVSSGTVTALQTAWNDILAGLNAGGNPMVLLHDPGETAVPGPTLVTTLTVASTVATQRRRLRG